MKILWALLFILSYTCSYAQHRLRSICWERIPVSAYLDSIPNAEAQHIASLYKQKVDSVMAPTLGMSRVFMAASRPESLLSNWAADVLVEGSTATGLPRADMGLINVGGLRSNMPEGVVCVGDIYHISPFQNHLVILEMHGKELQELMHNIAAVYGEGVSSSVKMEISKQGKLLSATIAGEPIDPRRTYTIATLDYLAEGNDKMYALAKHQRMHQTGLTIRSVMMESIIKNRIITSKIEGRIIVR